jgi:hypothetical protein
MEEMISPLLLEKLRTEILVSNLQHFNRLFEKMKEVVEQDLKGREIWGCC